MGASRQPPLIVGNWKMGGRLADVDDVRRLGQALIDRPARAQVVLCPPATLICLAHRALEGSGAHVGAQDCHADAAGAFTGALSAGMLADVGAAFVLVGHAERRRLDHETDSTVAQKAHSALRGGLTPILCVGETLAQRRGGQTSSAIRRQLRGSCPAAFGAGEFVVAYEPVWAIGSGTTPKATEIADAHRTVRAELTRLFGSAGEHAPILYGGSVEAGNAASILQLDGVDGLLVGRASLSSVDFLPIIRCADALGRPAPRLETTA